MAERSKIDELAAKITAKAWKDPSFKKRLLQNPKAVLKEMGVEIPKNLEIRILEDTENTRTYVLPQPSGNVEEMSEAELEKVSGGIRFKNTKSECGYCG